MLILLIYFSFPGFTTNHWVIVNLQAVIYSCVNSVISQSKYYKYTSQSHALVLEM